MKETTKSARPRSGGTKFFQQDFVILLRRSEERIDKTNEMICKLVETSNNMAAIINKITAEYSLQLEKLQASRDKILAQNSALLALLDKFSPNGTTNVNINKNEK